jgi:ribosomal protein S18 acetylase RimI-like enzyme
MAHTVCLASGAAQYDVARVLIEEYARELGIDLCFQGFAEELGQLATIYGAPDGALFLAHQGAEPIATVGVRRLCSDTCEMKRLYVRKGCRQDGIGRTLALAALDAGRRLGYRRMVLDTLQSMTEARALYRSLGFIEIRPYYPNPLPGVSYLEKSLTGGLLGPRC